MNDLRAYDSVIEPAKRKFNKETQTGEETRKSTGINTDISLVDKKWDDLLPPDMKILEQLLEERLFKKRLALDEKLLNRSNLGETISGINQAGHGFTLIKNSLLDSKGPIIERDFNKTLIEVLEQSIKPTVNKLVKSGSIENLNPFLVSRSQLPSASPRRPSAELALPEVKETPNEAADESPSSAVMSKKEEVKFFATPNPDAELPKVTITLTPRLD